MATSMSGILGQYSQSYQTKTSPAAAAAGPYPDYQIMYPYPIFTGVGTRPRARARAGPPPPPNGLCAAGRSRRDPDRPRRRRDQRQLPRRAPKRRDPGRGLPRQQDTRTSRRRSRRCRPSRPRTGNAVGPSTVSPPSLRRRDAKASAKGWQALRAARRRARDRARSLRPAAAAGPAADTFQVKLIRQSSLDGTATDLGTLDLKDQSGASFQKSLTLTGNDLDRTVANLHLRVPRHRASLRTPTGTPPPRSSASRSVPAG